MTGRATPPDLAMRPPLPQRPPARRWSDLRPRLLSGIVMIALALTTAIIGGRLFDLFWLLAAVAVGWEWQRLIGAPGATIRSAIAAAALAAALLLAGHGYWMPAIDAIALGGLLVAILDPAVRALGFGGVLYAGALLLSVVVLRASAAGGAALLWLFAVVWGTDVMAYFGGRLIGGRKLWPRLSPSKTWAGFIVGVTSGSLAGLAVAPEGASRGAVLMIGAVAGALAQGGDLFESSLKRRFGVKDASHLIPGHGGVMDRLDGFIVAATFAACLGVAHCGLAEAGRGIFDWPG